MEECVSMMEASERIGQATAGAVAQLMQRLKDKDVELDESRKDNVAMKEWGGRVEARRLACGKRDELVRVSLLRELADHKAENVRLEAKNAFLHAELTKAAAEVERLREVALETCSVSRTIMLQNAHTRMEREIEHMRERASASASASASSVAASAIKAKSGQSQK